MVFGYEFLKDDYTVFSVLRRAGLPEGTSIRDMAEDYAEMIRQEFGDPVDVLGVSTGGSLALQFAADHPELVKRLVIHSSAYRLGEAGKLVQLEIAGFARQMKTVQAWETLIRFILPKAGLWMIFNPCIAWISSRILSLGRKKSLSDLVVTILAEDQFDLKGRLGEISAPTLVIAGCDDPFYSSDLFRETGAGIPNSQTVLFEKMRHPAMGRAFEDSVLAFLKNP